MSTRSTIYFNGGIHVYEEVLSGDICLEVEPFAWEGEIIKSPDLNDKYGSFTMSKEMWKQLSKELLEFLDNNKTE